MVREIERVWCLECGKRFWADKKEEYICPKCGKILNFKKENIRYIINK